MGVIGNFGSRIVFEVSDQSVITFSAMTQKVTGKYSKHSAVGQKDRPEFTGPGNRGVSFKMLIDIDLGIRPREVMERIEEAVETGETNYLVIGGRPVGNNKFYISSVSETVDVVTNGGGIARATLNVTMEEYL